MSLTLELSPETESQLRDAATRQHRDVSAYILEAVAEKMELQSLLDADPEAALDATIETLQIPGAQLCETALNRASFYED